MNEKLINALVIFYTLSPLSQDLKIKTISQITSDTKILEIVNSEKMQTEFTQEAISESIIALATAIKLEQKELSQFSSAFNAYELGKDLTDTLISFLNTSITPEILDAIQNKSQTASVDVVPEIKEEVKEDLSNLDDLF